VAYPLAGFVYVNLFLPERRFGLVSVDSFFKRGYRLAPVLGCNDNEDQWITDFELAYHVVYPDSGGSILRLNLSAYLLYCSTSVLFIGLHLYPIDFFEFMPDMDYSRRHKEWFPMISLGVGAFLPLSDQLSLDLGLRLGVIGGGATSDETLIYGRVPETVSAIHRNADGWNYLRLVVGIRADL